MKGTGRMFQIEFRDPRNPRPFAIGDQCHFGLGLFVPGTVQGPQSLKETELKSRIMTEHLTACPSYPNGAGSNAGLTEY
jgi:hypothetical protein